MISLQKKVSAFLQLQVELEDRKQWLNGLGPLLVKSIGEALSRREQVILFINRRGYAPRTTCRSCGNAQLCPHCAVALTYHADVKRNICHYWNYSVHHIEHCGYCQSKYLAVTGAGTQRVEEEIRSAYPDARVARLDLDSGRQKKYYQKLLTSMQAGEIDILIGTQMVAKGLDFPKVSLVGILDADALFALPDYRADERAFQLLIQAAGRAGRADKPGRVIIQTYRPEEPLMQLLVRQEYWEFALEALKQRKLLGYPPFTHVCRLLISGTDEPLVQHRAEQLQQLILDLLDARENEFTLLGPAPAPIAKIKDRYRYQLLLKSPSREFLVSVVNWCLRAKLEATVRIEHDFDPVHTM